MTEFLFHPWRWHRRPRPVLVNVFRALSEVIVAVVVCTILITWPWRPGWPYEARVLAAVFYCLNALVAVATMRRARQSGTAK